MDALKEIEDKIIKAAPLSDDEVRAIENVWEIPIEKRLANLLVRKRFRWSLYMHWKMNLMKRLEAIMPALMAKYERTMRDIRTGYNNTDRDILQHCLIIGATTTGVARAREVLQLIAPRILIVEEAAEVLEGHLVGTFLPTIEHAILIGDHQQLRPNPSVFEMAQHYKMDVSLFERLVRNRFPYSMLTQQHRMLSLLTESIVIPHFYPK